MVDSECKKRAITIKDISRITWLIIAVITSILVIYSIMLVRDIIYIYAATPSVEKRTGYMVNQLLTFAALSLSAIGLLMSLSISVLKILRTSVEEQTEYYYRKLKERVGSNERAILKALIRLKCQNFDINLLDIYRQNSSLFEDQKLLKKLYDL